MRLFFLVITLHFVIGGVGIFLLNKKLQVEAKKRNWLKFVFYLLIYIIVLTSILTNKNAFLAIAIVLLSGSLIELLIVSKLPCKSLKRNQIVLISLAIFSVLTFFFSLFILLPPVLIGYTYTIVIIFDGASQISGHAFGKTKILPILSPYKTWEGLIGGTLSAVITSVILHNFAGLSISQSFIGGILICSASFLGDMAASAFKRSFNTKDFGILLPGQGGILDRFDSFIASGALLGFIVILIYSSHLHIDRNIAVYLGYSMVFTFILFLGELIQSLLIIRSEFSRIFSHVMAGLSCLFMINLFTSHWYIIAICVQSALFLLITKKLNLFNSHHKVERKTYGSSVFFIGILATYFIYTMKSEASLFMIPVAVLTISDPVASLTGLNSKSGFWPSYINGTEYAKTYKGSLGFFISTFILLVAGLSFFYTFSLWQLIIIALGLSSITTITELISPKGTDNLSIPLVLSISLILFAG